MRDSKRSYGGPQTPGVNPLPFVLGIFVIGIAAVIAMNGSWIGQVMRRGPAPEDPLGGVNQMQARQLIEQRITEGLASVGAKGKFSWNVGGQPGDINSPAPIELTVDTSLADKNARHQIINPIKDYMERAKIPTLTMNDAKSHSTWTYTCQLRAPSPEDNSDGLPPQPQAEGEATAPAQ
ncbi:MAG TPA: hypothetical protein EYN91_20815 [Candidatus Melainabacteria bacterium]|nr:hypothetical protein [Candidatus Melainabacteria bacterium]